MRAKRTLPASPGPDSPSPGSPGRYNPATVLRSLAADLLHAVLPSDCRVCGSPMLGLRTVRLCDACLDSVNIRARVPEERCLRCGDALGMESARFAASMGIGECTSCRMQPPAFARAVAFGPYEGELREMLHALKFGGVSRVATAVLGKWLAEALLQLEPEAARSVVMVAVPLFTGRQRERGYNQAELLAHSALRQMRKQRPEWKVELCTDALLRVRDTRALYELRPDQRRRNLQGAFRVGNEAAVRDREILLVDDILTTGATANQCAKVLLKAGARRIWVATVARAQPESILAVATHEGVPDVARWDAPVQVNVAGEFGSEGIT